MIDRIEEARMSAQVEAQIASLLERAFPEPPGFDGRSFYTQRHHVRLVRRDPQIIGHLAVCLRTVRLGDRLLKMAGFAEVATDPDRRGEGVASALVKAGVEEARAMRADIVALFGTAGLYSGAEFRSIPNPIRFADLMGVKTGEVRELTTDAFKILPLIDVPWDDQATLDLVGGEF